MEQRRIKFALPGLVRGGRPVARDEEVAQVSLLPAVENTLRALERLGIGDESARAARLVFQEKPRHYVREVEKPVLVDGTVAFEVRLDAVAQELVIVLAVCFLLQVRYDYVREHVRRKLLELRVVADQDVK